MIPADLAPIANHLWQSTAFAMAAALLTLAFRKNRAAVRYWVWFAASAKFLIPFSLLVTLGSQFEWRTEPAVAQPQFTAVITQISQPFEISGGTFSSPAVLPESPSHLPGILLAIWLCGVVVGFLYWLRLLRETAKIRREATPLHLNLPIPVLEAAPSTRIEPGVFGIFKPVLILPRGITDTLTPAQLDAVITHELHHVHRKDNLTAAIHMIVEILFWFHPLALYIRHRLVEERERACDEAVAAAVHDPQTYAEAILNICKLYVASPLPCVSGITGADLKKRIEGVMKSRTSLRLNFTRKAALALAAIAATAGPLMIGIANAPAVLAQSKGAHSQAKVSFEVASVRPAMTPGRGPAICLGRCSPGERLTVQGNRVEIRFMPISDLLTRAYGVKPYQLSGPDWMSGKRWDINAEIPAGVSADRLPEMLQALLVDRFKLRVHHETRTLPVFPLLVGKNGIKLPPAAPDAANQPPAGPKALQMYTPDGDAHAENGHITISGGQFGPARSGPGGKWDMLAITMPALAELIGTDEDHPVVDQTNLPGAYHFTFEINMQEGKEGEAAPNLVLNSMLDSLDKGGLKLERRNAPIDTIVVDHVEKEPTAN